VGWLPRRRNEMTLGYDRTLYILAFDHRGSFKKMFGIPGEPTPEEFERICDGKTMIYEGFLRAIADGGLAKDVGGVLVDEEFGNDVARKAKADGVGFAMPVEKSGQDEFDFEYGESFGDHIEDFDPTFSKVLVRANPAWDREMSKRQLGRLRRLGDWLHDHGRKYLFELLVPATEAQLASVGGDADRYDQEVRPKLMMEVIEEAQDAGVEPDIWKIEGLEDREQCRQIAQLVRRDGRDEVSCVVLGRGADDAKVDAWLRAGAGLPGYIGFAIGRSIFGASIKGTANGTMDRETATALIARNYARFIAVYEGRA
jgi:myo-inositol catabolism protein IolC